MVNNKNTKTDATTTLIRQTKQLIVPTNNLMRAVHKERLGGLQAQKREILIQMDVLSREMTGHVVSLITLDEKYQPKQASNMIYFDLITQEKRE